MEGKIQSNSKKFSGIEKYYMAQQKSPVKMSENVMLVMSTF